MNLEELEKEVKRRADDLTPELLPQLLERLLAREGLVQCERHEHHLLAYVRAQITLTRAKRNYCCDSDCVPSMGYYPSAKDTNEMVYLAALKRRDEIRQTYRSKPCTCWVQHR
jgi:hypothetical protein